MRDISLDKVKKLLFECDFFAETGDIFIDRRYDDHMVNYGHYEPYYRMLYHVARHFMPSLTVELGGWQGTGAAHLASGWVGGIVVTIDHHTDPGDDLNKILMQEAEKEYSNLVYLQGWTWDMKEHIERIKIPIDILFIDSWHDYNHAMRDWNDYKSLLANPALVICDDILSGYGPVISGMMDFWNDLPGKEKWLNENLRKGIPMGFMIWRGEE